MRKRVKCGFSEENARFLGGKSHFIKYLAFGNERRNIHKTNKHSIAHTLSLVTFSMHNIRIFTVKPHGRDE
jgi:hypothetical protein